MRATIVKYLLGICFTILALPIWAANPPGLVNTLQEAADEPDLAVHQRYQYQDELQRDTPRGTLAGFTNAAYEQDFELAAEYLDLRYLPDNMSKDKGPQYAKKLQAIIDRNLWIELEDVNDTPQGVANDNLPAYRDAFGRIAINSGHITLLLQRVPSKGGSIWKISNATVAKVPNLYDQLGYGPVVEWFVDNIPEGRLFKINLWEWSLILCYLIGAFMVIIPLTWLAKWLILRSKSELKQEVAYVVAGPLRFFLAVVLCRAWIAHSSISAGALAVIDSGFLLMLAVVWLVWSALGIFQAGLKQRWLMRDNQQGASLLRPLTNFVRIIFVIIAVLVWLEHLGFNASAILAGMGIGGVAIALASKQSIENFIGTITLYSAAPIKVGNLCRFGTINGTVEEMGLRCTQIRTLDRTLIHVPNAKLAEMEIENISEREKIRFKADIRLDYAITNSKQLKDITSDIRTMLEQHEQVEADPLRVTFQGFGLHGLQVNVFAYVATTSFPTYQLVAQELHLGIMDIVNQHGSRIIPVAPIATK
ncbi:mechanosensitive ion channel family protein [Shewanella waksmanii]|uniref:mechanosensitive ion channel family protein n=1 Tax=Shewanella waksmanii TaxID=213783 RepID=UPI0004ACDC29|nr:mechanosensitive ion channel family protein [Shewanella waksmanii]